MKNSTPSFRLAAAVVVVAVVGSMSQSASAFIVAAPQSPSLQRIAFEPSSPPSTAATALHMSDFGGGNSFSGSDFGSVEEIEFRIYPDGRIEETVRGVRGENCHKVTEAINGMLGKVVRTASTEELYENEVVVTSTVTDKVSNGSGGVGGSSSSSGDWEGSSSW